MISLQGLLPGAERYVLAAVELQRNPSYAARLCQVDDILLLSLR